MDQVTMLGRAVDELTGLIDRLDEEALAQQTPCEAWTVRELLNHLIGGSTVFATSAETGTIGDEEMGRLMSEDQLGDDFKQAWKRASSRAVEAFRQPGVLDRTVKLPFGEMPGSVAASIAVFDLTTHACDLARSTGQEVRDTELAELALGIGQQMIGPDLRRPGAFGPEQACEPDAPAVERLLAFAGRTPA